MGKRKASGGADGDDGRASERVSGGANGEARANGGKGASEEANKAFQISGLLARLGEHASRFVCPKTLFISLVYYQLIAQPEIQLEKLEEFR